MSNFRSPDVLERRNNAAAVKKAMLEKFRAAAQDPALDRQRLNRIAVNEARTGRIVTREAHKKVREAERAVALGATQKTDRDARYWARKAAKKVRRRGY